jgi:Spy/CpxP family protein refolding chaperone
MNRWIRTALLSSSLIGALALVPSAVAFASDAAHGEAGPHGHEWHGGGLLGAALKLDSLTADQRAAIEKLIASRKAAGVPVRQAEAQLLTILAQQVEQAKIDPQGLSASVHAEQNASNAKVAAGRDALAQLHAILSAAQRQQLVDRIEQARHGHEGDERGKGREAHEGGHEGPGHGGRWLGRALDLTPGQEAQIRANLEAERNGAPDAHAGHGGHGGERGKLLEGFRGDAFDPSTFVTAHVRGVGIERLAEAAVPVLTPEQRATLANLLRQRAAHESAPKGA